MSAASGLSLDQRKLLLSVRQDEDWRTNDGVGFEEGLRYPWRSADALIRRDLLRYVGWIDEHAGREYEATVAGIAWLREHGWERLLAACGSIYEAFDGLGCGITASQAQDYLLGSAGMQALRPEDRGKVFGLALGFAIVAIEADREHRPPAPVSPETAGGGAPCRESCRGRIHEVGCPNQYSGGPTALDDVRAAFEEAKPATSPVPAAGDDARSQVR